MDPRAGKPGPPVSLSACPQPARVFRFPLLSGQGLRKLADQGPGVGWTMGLWVVNPGWLMGMLGTQGLHWFLSFSAVTLALGSSIGVRCGVPRWPLLSLLSATAPSFSPLSCSDICMAAIPLPSPGSPGPALAGWEQLMVLEVARPSADLSLPF